ncbi:hypothetical protein MKEN_01384900 [Mycena kentingensis (nom. inval.)]|nr:hypothetical protein MKEN_01384900 [Mycena kentingensis (nom. inval.)]
MPRTKKIPVAPPSFHVFGDLPLDVGLGIFSLCSPFDLVQLAATSKSNRTLIQAHEYLWESAHDNIARGECPRLPTRPVIETSGNYSQEAYVLWVFGGGPCSHCTKPTTSLPFHFLFRFRACSSRCEKILMSREHLYFCSAGQFDALAYTKGLPRLTEVNPWMTTHYAPLKAVKNAKHEANAATQITKFKNFSLRGHRPPAFCNFKRRTLPELEEEYLRRCNSRPVIEKSANELQDWRDLYLADFLVVSEANNAFVVKMAKDKQVKVTRLHDAPTMKGLVDAFNRDLELLTPHVWTQHAPKIFEELKDKPSGKNRCTLCNRTVSTLGLEAHMFDSHKDQASDLNTKGKAYCKHCPDSKRLYTREGLEEHRRVCHSGPLPPPQPWKRCPLCPARERRFKSVEGRAMHDRVVHGMP